MTDGTIPTAEEFRAAGFTERAANYPLSEAAFAWLCTFNGVTAEQTPRSWRYAPNPVMQAYLERMGQA